MKKFKASLILIIITLFCLYGCGENKPDVHPTSTEIPVESSSITDEVNPTPASYPWGEITIKYNYTNLVDAEATLHPGDTVEMSGNAVSEGDFLIYLSSNNETEERYILGKAEKYKNSWSCNFRLSRWGMKTNDDQFVELPECLYAIIISDGTTDFQTNVKVDMKKGYYKDFTSKDIQSVAKGAIFLNGGNLYSYNADSDKIQQVYSRPAFLRSYGLSPDKSRLAFTSYAGEESVICIYYMNQGEITYIPAQYDFNNGVLWLNENIIISEGHHNPSANAFACYNTGTGGLVSSAIGLDALPAPDGSFILFRLSPHWIESPLPDNIESTQLLDAGKSLYTVKNPDDKIVLKKLSDDGKKLFFIESLNNGELRLNWADLTENGLVNITGRSLAMGNNSYYSALVSENLQEAYVVYCQNLSDNIFLYHTKTDENSEHTEEHTLLSSGYMNKNIELIEKNQMRYLVRILDTGEVNIDSGWPIVTVQLYELNDELKLVSESEKMDYSKYTAYLNDQLTDPVDPKQSENLRKAAKEFFDYSFDCSLEEMGINDIEWFGLTR